MAHTNLPNLPAFPLASFPQPILDALDREISRIDQIVEKELERCEYESPETRKGACDGGFPCHKLATVTDVRTGNVFCLNHFEGVIL